MHQRLRWKRPAGVARRQIVIVKGAVMMSQVLRQAAVAAIYIFAPLQLVRTVEYRYKIPGATIIYAVVTSSFDATMVVFSTDDRDSEDLSSGTPAILDVAKSKITRLPKLEVLSNDSSAVWRRDGRHVIFGAGDGLYELDTDHPKHPRMILEGGTHGIALSGDESKLAYWRWGKSSLELYVLNIATSKILQKWDLPYLYGSDAYGFEVAFLGEDTLYARTYDTVTGTPLKSFDISTGKMRIVQRDCGALVASGTAIYFLGQTASGRVLKKLTITGSEVIPSVTGYDSLRAAAGGRWIAFAGKGRSALFDTRSDQIFVKSTCEAMTALWDGTPLFISKTVLSSDPAICAASQ